MKQVEEQMRSKEGLWRNSKHLQKLTDWHNNVTNETRNNNKNTKISEP